MKKRLIAFGRKLNDMLSASALAELGAAEYAREVMAPYGPPEYAGEWEKDMAAITFAEAGEFDAARMILEEHELHPTTPDECQFGDNDLCYLEA